MTYKEREKTLCNNCEAKKNCSYISRNLERKCTFQETTMYGWELGWQDAIDKTFDFLIERYENQGAILLEDINELIQMMEEQQ